MSLENFEQFKKLVLQDLDLQRNLQNISDRELFVAEVVKIGGEQGFNFSEETILNVMRENKQMWIERWI